MAQIIPAILENNFLDFDEKLLIASNLSSRIQIDVLDGILYENKTLEISEWSDLPDLKNVDIHLMVDGCGGWIEKFRNINIDLIIGQYEGIKDVDDFIFRVKTSDRKVGIALDIDTPIFVLQNFYQDLDSIVLMAIKTGYSGQDFDIRVFDKIKGVRQIIGNSAEIIIDGGINLETGKKCLHAGADCLVVNSFLWDDPEENFCKLAKLI